MKTALSFAGSDPTSGAGIQLDLKVFNRFGLLGLTVINSITAQNTRSVKTVYPLPKKIIEEQLTSLAEDFKIDAAKTGMIYTAYAVEVFAAFIQKHRITHLVIDPVLVSSTGRSLSRKGTIDALKSLLMPLAEVITPNIYEAEVLTGIKIKDSSTILAAMERLREAGAENIIITGGDTEDEWVIDYFFNGDEFLRFRSKRHPGSYHGTGCCFSAAITAGLAQGLDVLTSVKRARRFVNKAIRTATKETSGLGLLMV
ncbi:MAG: bifunctional hydroxymethylpyrimidine kinase/phosphomethylpyrimidine kinase [Nitrospirae bacterium]|nr:bifunctional hydroxymethylpyrimidine kinase/phosphomethylpyrimidine kinase [Nitrospirota bacterium]